MSRLPSKIYRIFSLRPTRLTVFLWLPAAALILISCNKSDDPEPKNASGTFTLHMEHHENGMPLQLHKLIYANQAGNQYMVTGLKYFISDITLHYDGGKNLILDGWKDIFYIDEDIPGSLSWQFFDQIPAMKYDSVSFIFGITGAKNQSFMFVNPPEALMMWPQVLGGGYHYLMLDGKWKDTAGVLQPFNFHLGIGQLYKGPGFEVDSIYAFVQNWFRVSLPGSGFQMAEGGTVTLHLAMDIENWFRDPYVFDFNHWGGAIMQLQPAMEQVRENGRNVFSVIRFSNGKQP